MIFGSPHFLWLLPAVALLAALDFIRRAAHASGAWPKITRAWAGLHSLSIGTQHAKSAARFRLLFWPGLALVVVALARPQYGRIDEPVFDQSREVMLAVDLSRSMLTPDVRPSRLARAKLLIQSLLDRLKGERVGLIVFSGTAFLQSPLSADYEILREFLPALNSDYLPEGGTNYQALIETALTSFGDTAGADRYLIILSDGEATDDNWKPLAEKLKDRGIRVIGLGIGTVEGAFIPDGAGNFVKDERGAVVLSRLESSTLQELARLTGGAYADASTWVDLPAVLQQTVEAGRKGEFREKNNVRQVERFQWALALALLLLLLSFWREFPVRPRVRDLPLQKNLKSQISNPKTPNSKPQTPNSKLPAAAAGAALVLACALAFPAPALFAREASPNSDDATAGPLVKLVGHLATQNTLPARDCADLARTTLTYGQRKQSAGEPAPEGSIRDGLAAVDAGEKLDPKAADWSQLRRDLSALLKKPEPPPQPQPQQNQGQSKQDQSQKEDQKKQSNQNQKSDQQRQSGEKNKDQKNSADQNKSGQEQQQQSPSEKSSGGEKKDQPKQPDSAFGDMSKPDEKKPPEPPREPKPAQSPDETQKVGGTPSQPDRERLENPGLVVPLQKLDQVRAQDSPAKLFQLMEGEKKTPDKKGKDW